MKYFFLVAILATSCAGGKKTPAETVVKEYDHPAIPAMLEDPEAQMEWLAEHYWDDFEFSDTTRVDGWGRYAEQAIVNMAYGLQQSRVPQRQRSKLIETLFRKAAVNKAAFGVMAEIAEKYFFDPNSPIRDDEMFIAALEGQLRAGAWDEYERIRPQEQLRMVLKNRVGTVANDFRYTLANGQTGTLHGFKAQWTLLFINNPGCPACREMMEAVMNSDYLMRLIGNGQMRVLGIYPDEDLAEWRNYAANFPPRWVNAYDATLQIKNEELYDLKAIPTMYLLDETKKVILRDVTDVRLVEEAIQYK